MLLQSLHPPGPFQPPPFQLRFTLHHGTVVSLGCATTALVFLTRVSVQTLATGGAQSVMILHLPKMASGLHVKQCLHVLQVG